MLDNSCDILVKMIKNSSPHHHYMWLKATQHPMHRRLQVIS